MKKYLIFLVIIIIAISTIWINYSNYKVEYNKIQKENAEFSDYLDKEITGTELTTVINRAIDYNTKNNIQKNEKGIYIENDTNSIKIDIQMADDKDKIYPMEAFYNNKMENFIEYYKSVKFECTNIEYHNKTNRVKHMYFEQVSI